MSKLTNWMEEMRKSTVISSNQTRVQKPVTLRLDGLRSMMLEDLADKVGMTKTALGEQIMELAIIDAWEAFKGGRFEPEDLRDLEARLGKSSGILPPPVPPIFPDFDPALFALGNRPPEPPKNGFTTEFKVEDPKPDEGDLRTGAGKKP
jgi:hypothetical protein